jgi:CCR4-NOT transcription complex subunit 4
MSKIEEKSKLNAHLNNPSKPLPSVSKTKKIDTVLAQKMTNYRIIQKNLVYVIGLSEKLTNKELLGKYDYFGQYGQILKIIVNKHKAYYGENQKKPSYSAYISYSSPSEAASAILAIDSVTVDDSLIRASFGTTKYCTFFLKNLDCPNKECLYMHSLADDEVIVNKDEFNSTTTGDVRNYQSYKNIFYEQHLLAIKMANIFNKDVKGRFVEKSKRKSVFPNLESIYKKDLVIENDPEGLKKTKTPNHKSKINLGNFNNFNNGNKFDKFEERKFNSYGSNSQSNNVTPKHIDASTTINKNLNFDEKLEKIEKFNSDKLNIEINEKLNENKSEENSTNSNTPQISTSPNSEINNNPIDIKKNSSIYRNREKSRFPFVPTTIPENESHKDSDETKPIPEYIFDLINKKVSRYTFFKKFENDFNLDNKNDKIYVEESFKKCRHYRNDSWADFIFTNINLQNNN